MPSNYPTALDSLTNPAAGSTLANPPHHTQHGDLNDAVEAIEAELGLSPSGVSATVAARLDASEVLRGSSFPAQPAYGNNRPFYRTDLNMSYFYDGTRWLSTQQHSHIYVPPAAISVTTTWIPLILPWPGGYGGIYVDFFSMLFSVAGGGSALSASHKWVVQWNDTPSDAAIAGPYSIDSGASGGTYRSTNLVTQGTVSANTKLHGYVSAAKTGTPGDLTIHGIQLHYRIKGP